MRQWKGILLVAFVVLACSGGSNGDDDDDDDDGRAGPGSWKSCVADADCPSSEGCDTESGSLSPGYCTPLCNSDGNCPGGYSCPGRIKGEEPECDDKGEHKNGAGICDQFDGVYGPTTC